jgi:hypothetical protein
MKTEPKYRTFDELVYEVATDFVQYNNEGMIEPGQLIKVAQRVNYDLGLRIHGTKEKIIDIEKNKTRLPDDFYVLNYAFLCGKYTVSEPVLQGRQTENVILNSSYCSKCGEPDPECTCEKTYAVECNTGEKIFVQVVEKRAYETRTYETFEKIHISSSTGKKDALDNSGRNGYIKNGFIYTDVEEGRLYISYQGALEDHDGNLLVLDHPMINEYYEYALKQRILENLYMNGEEVTQKMQLVEQRLRAARNNALTIVNTPDFAEMKQLWETNRKAQYAKYYDMFKSGYGL